jgi:hypothetical protein
MRQGVKNVKGFLQPSYLIMLGALIAAFAAAGASLNPSQPRRWAVLTVAAAIIGIAGTVWSDRSNDAKAAEVDALQKRILQQSLELESYTRGSGSYPYIEPTVRSNRHAAIGALIGVGRNPLYDVLLRIVPDPERRLPAEGGIATYEILEEAMKLERWIDVGTINPSADPKSQSPRQLIPFDLGQSENRRAYNIFFSTRNGQFVQYLRFAHIADRWFVAYRIVEAFSDRDGRTLKEIVQEGYPLNSSGQVDWQREAKK